MRVAVHSRVLLETLAAWSVASFASADVLVVDTSGAPTSHATLQAAIFAAVDGDTLLVKPGTYPGFVVDGKALTIVADPEGSVLIDGEILFTNLGAGKQLTFAGFRFHDATFGGLRALDMAGSLRLEALESTGQTIWIPGGPTHSHAIRLNQCADVAILRSTLIGGPSSGLFPSSPGAGLWAQHSRIALYDSTVRGGRGSNAQYQGTSGSLFPPLDGSDGCVLLGSSVVLFSGSTCEGGPGGAGAPGLCFPPSPGTPGAAGGAGLLVAQAAQVWVLDTTLRGGLGGDGGPSGGCSPFGGDPGADGPASSGVVAHLPGTRRVLRCATVVREQQILNLELEGEPGDVVWFHGSLGTNWYLDLPFSGVRLVGGGGRRLLGVLPGGGSLDVAMPVGSLGPNTAAQTRHIQSFFRSTSGASFHGSPAVFVVLDGSF